MEPRRRGGAEHEVGLASALRQNPESADSAASSPGSRIPPKSRFDRLPDPHSRRYLYFIVHDAPFAAQVGEERRHFLVGGVYLVGVERFPRLELGIERDVR
jgi:hypothetical protein